MPQHLGTGTIGAIINATIGAIPLLVIIRLVRGRWGSPLVVTMRSPRLCDEVESHSGPVSR
jgi:hypothetical protein